MNFEAIQLGNGDFIVRLITGKVKDCIENVRRDYVAYDAVVKGNL